MPTSLILPVAADKEEYKGEMPYLFRLDRKGIMICLAAIKGLELDKFDGVYITILKKHNDIYKLEDLLDGSLCLLLSKWICIKKYSSVFGCSANTKFERT